MSSVPDPAEFAGVWTIDRDLSDLRSGDTGHFTGQLIVAAEGAGYDWRESGMLTWGDYTGRAERQLCLRPHDGTWWMCFADGRLFHPWRFGEQVVHPCAADVYLGRIECEPDAPDRFTITWDVTGPAKRLLIVSRMTRQPAAASTTRTPSIRTSRANTR